jgi:hypothetical protein
MKREGAISVLERWEGSGAVWKAVHVSDELAILDLCTCYGEPVDRIETREPDAIAYVRDRLDDEPSP